MLRNLPRRAANPIIRISEQGRREKCLRRVEEALNVPDGQWPFEQVGHELVVLDPERRVIQDDSLVRMLTHRRLGAAAGGGPVDRGVRTADRSVQVPRKVKTWSMIRSRVAEIRPEVVLGVIEQLI